MALFNALFIGGQSSYVGESTVGNGFIFIASGSIKFTGTAPWSIHVNYTAAGSLAFSGHAPLEGKRSTSGSVDFLGRAGKQYTKVYGGAVAFSGAAITNISGSIAFRGSTGGINFEGTSIAFKSKEYNTNISEQYFVGVGTVGSLRVGDSKALNSLLFTGTVFKQSQSTKIATGTLDFVSTSNKLNIHKVFVSTGILGFSGDASYQRSVRSNIWIIKDSLDQNNDQGLSSIWEGDAVIDEATVQATAAAISSNNGGSDNIWGTA